MEDQTNVCPTPVLFLIHRRPELAARVLASIRQVRPTRLLVAADGPEEDALCRQTRSRVLDGIDWPCQVETRFSKHPLGCRRAVSQAIDWAFSLHEKLIIIEDDCLPHLSFFRFCTELLDRYESHCEVMQICGCNEADYQPSDGASYFASRFPSIWGWASWRRAWAHHDPVMKSWPDMRRGGEWLSSCRIQGEAAWRKGLFDAAYHDKVDAWSIAWCYAQHLAGGLSLIPTANLVENLGWAADALHTRDVSDPRARMTTRDVGFPLRHPEPLMADEKGALGYFEKYCRSPSLVERVKRKVRRMIESKH
jgi:hypothetical protein